MQRTMKRPGRLAVAGCCALMLLTNNFPTLQAAENPRLPALLNATLPALRRAHIPVYVPTWLPPTRMHLYATAGVINGGNGYFINLSSSPIGGDAALVFTMLGQVGPPNVMGRKVSIGHGLTAHLDEHRGGNEGPTISWAVGKYSYEIGKLYPDGKLIRAARSVIRVNVRG